MISCTLGLIIAGFAVVSLGIEDFSWELGAKAYAIGQVAGLRSVVSEIVLNTFLV